MKDKFKVTLVWEMSKTVEVEVDIYDGNYADAGEIAIRDADSSGGMYVEDSMSAPFIDWKEEVDA